MRPVRPLIGEWWRRLRFWLRRAELDRDLEEEIRFHLERRQQDLGEAPARRQFGNVTSIREESRDMWTWASLENLTQNLRYAWRTMRRNPGFTAAAVLALGLGIGANTAIFTLINTVMLKSLPVPDPERLMLVSGRHQGAWWMVTYPVYREIAERQQSLEGILVAVDERPARVVIPAAGQQRQLDNTRRAAVSANYFDILGVRPFLGRFFTADDDRDPLSAETRGSVAVLSYGFWERQFGRDPSVLGKTITVDRGPCTIVGVAPKGFFGQRVGSAPEVWTPLVPFYSPGQLNSRGGTFASLMGRLKPGVDPRQAAAELTTLYQHSLSAEIPGNRTTAVKRNTNPAEYSIELRSGATGERGLRSNYGEPLLLGMGVVAFVLLIACANVGNLLLARAASRRREIGVRLALGAGRARLIVQMLTESMLLAVLGAGVGLVMAAWGSSALASMIEFGPSPISLDLTLDLRVLAFTSAVTLLTALLFGLAPAMQSASAELVPALKEATGGSAGRPRQRLSRVFVVVQVALSLVLLFGAGLIVKSLMKLHDIDTGFERRNLIVVDVGIGERKVTPERWRQIATQLQDRLRAIPGVESASTSYISLFSNNELQTPVVVPGYQPQPGETVMARFNTVTRDYFETVGMRFLAGRGFTTSDPAAVAVVNESFARRYFGTPNAVGRFIEQNRRTLEIVGVLKDAKLNNLRRETEPMMYFTWDLLPVPVSGIEVRTPASVATMLPRLRQAVNEVSSDAIIRNVKTIAQQIDRTLSAERMVVRLAGFFSVLALVLVAIGLYGMLSFAVVRRTREIGVRMALGARATEVRWMVVGDALRMAAIGAAIGVPAALACGSVVEKLLYGTKPTDPSTAVVALLIVFAVIAAAAWLPALRASRVDPMRALREE